MTCDQAKTLVEDSLDNTLGNKPGTAVHFELEAHILDCPVCSVELAAVRKTWNEMGKLPEVEPGPEVRPHFYQMLEAYQQGREEKKTRGFSWLSWWPQQPVLQFGLSAALLVIGIFAGHSWAIRNQKSAEVSQLRTEMDTMRQLVTLSLLQQQSASDRLRGVTWSYRVEQSDTEVLSALLRTVNQDPNVNVRLATVDALRKFGESPITRKALVQALARQTSPMVEIALIDLLVELREKPASFTFKTMLEKPDLDPNVKKRIESALQQLQ
jgi:hypothetical protein